MAKRPAPFTPERIHREISRKIANGASYIDCLVEFANENKVEVEVVADIVKKSTIFKEKLREEAKHLRLVKRDPSDESAVC